MEEDLLELIKLDDQINLGIFFDKNLEKNINWEQIAKTIINPKNGCEKYILAHMYFNGFGFEKNFQKAFNYYSSSISLKNSLALKDLELTANQGNEDAQIFLGDLYQYGYSIKKDTDKALYYFELAGSYDEIYDVFKDIFKNKKKFIEFYKKYRKLEAENKRLKNELDCIPERGKIYFEAKKHFENNTEKK